MPRVSLRPEGRVAPPHVQQAFMLLGSATIAFGFSMAAQQNIVSNFFENELGLKGPQFGYITAIREIPGFLLIFLTALLYRLSLPHLTAFAMVLLAIGFGFFGFATSFWTVAPWVIISSMGYHTWLQTQTALGMSMAEESKSGTVLGKLTALNQAGALVAMGFVFLAFQFDLIGFKGMFIICGLLALVAAALVFRFPNMHNGELLEVKPERERMVLKRDYDLYYKLSLLDGARQQIFFSFGLWVLVDHFRLDVPAISLIMLATAGLAMVSGPWIGRMLDKHGERQMLGVVNIAYIVALLGYALIDNTQIAVGCYVIYSLIMPLSAMGAAVYLRKIAPTRDVAPSLAMGVTMQHAAAIVIPVVTGFVLNFVGYQIPFLVASGFALITVFVTRKLDVTMQKTNAKRDEELARATV
ncbi:MAG: MFS transporter [Thermomicrobiales bacterium]|nr:MFS transporter [Thermomicrobiales bacterium]MCO5217514.1 MFS transporter [Thermomicrobiales bacterium]